MRWLLLLVFVACKAKSNPPPPAAPPKTPAPPGAAAVVVDAAAAPDGATVAAAVAIDAGVTATPSACPTLPDSMGWWVEEVAPACPPQPFLPYLTAANIPNVCIGACPHPCQITVNKRVAKISYDEHGRWTATSPVIDVEVDASDACTYDASGRASCTRSFKTPTTMTVKRDDKGHVVAIVDKDPITFKYDDAGHVVSATGFDATSKYTYDKQGRLVREDDPSSGKVSYKYNGTGQLTERKASSGTTTYKYKDGRLVEMTKKEGEDSANSSVQSTAIHLAYDGTGRLVSISSTYESDEPTVTTFVYDCK